MNHEEIERHLRQLPAPELPEAWRAEILSTALREGRASQPAAVRPSFLVYARQVFRRNPLTYGALTALWMLIFAFKAGTPVEPFNARTMASLEPQQPVELISLSNKLLLAQLDEEEPKSAPIP